MTKQYFGTSGSVAGKRFAIIVSTYHKSITSKLLDGAIQTLTRNQISSDDIEVFWVPGAFEIPLAVQHVLDRDDPDRFFDGVITLGCVIRGETTHDQHINTSVSQLIGQLSVEFKIPVGFGVLTCNTMDQAIQRAGGDVGNKGVEVAEAVIHMLQLFEESD
ncbi:MAG: 6,7-dimethyl-8-ribityllumazine synthase [Planctomycetota bacterium]